jgi:hypothetical protein
LTEAIHPPLDRPSFRPGKRFEDFSDFFRGTGKWPRSDSRPALPGSRRPERKRAAQAPPVEAVWPSSKEDDHLAMMMVVMLVVPPPWLLVMLVVVMMMVMHAVSRRRLHGAGKRAGGDEDGNEA